MTFKRFLKHRVFGRVPILTLGAIIVGAILLNFLYTGPSGPSDVKITEMESLLPEQVLENSIEAVVLVFPSETFGPFRDVEHKVGVTMLAKAGKEIPSPTVTLSFPTTFSLTSIISPESNYTIGYTPFEGTIKFFLPGNGSAVTLGVEGYLSSTSVLWRNSVDVPPIFVSSNFGGTSMRYLISRPSGSRVLDMLWRSPNDPSRGQALPPADVVVGGRRYINPGRIAGFPSATILYEPVERSAASSFSLFSLLAVVGATPYLLNAGRLKTFEWRLVSLGRIYHKLIRQLNSNRLLGAYIFVAFLMVSLSLFAGPDPRMKVFVLADPSTSEDIAKEVEALGGVALTTEDTRTELETMSNFGAIRVVIIADYISPSADYARRFLFPALDNVPEIILVPSENNEFQMEVEGLYPGKVIKAELSMVGTVLYRQTPGWVWGRNALGLEVDVPTFLEVARVVGLLSFVLVFFGLAFLARQLLEIGSKPTITRIAEAAVYAVAYYTVTQAVHMTSSALLAIPLGLHAVTSGSLEVTALGLLGLGGGSRPRMLAALLGVLIGSLTAARSGFKLDKTSVFVVVFFLLLISLTPLYGGIFYHELILMFSVGPDFEAPQYATSLARHVTETFGMFFGGWVTPVYALSRGILLYYMGVIPLAFISKLRSTTATLLLIMSAFAISQGGIRVAEMTPWKTLTDIVPGVVGGLAVVIPFSLISRVEGVLRDRLAK